MRLRDNQIFKNTSVIPILIFLIVLLQLYTSFVWFFYLIIGSLIYYLFKVDVDIRGSVFEREMTALDFDRFSKKVNDFLIKNVSIGYSISYFTLFYELKQREKFPEFLLLRVLQDLEFQGIIESYSENDKEKQIVLMKSPKFRSDF